MKELTERQRLVLNTIRELIAEHGYSPTIKEIAELVGTVPAGIERYVVALIKKGYVSRLHNKSRTIRILNEYG